MNIDTVISDIIHREGGFVDHSADRGGPTKYGITLATLETARGKDCTKNDIACLSEAEARDIYHRLYVTAPGFDRITDDRLAGLVVDCAVHSGTSRAMHWLQEAAGVSVDGIMGPKTLAAIPVEPDTVYRRLLAIRIRYLGRLITADPKQAVFASGWFNRIAEFVEG